MSEDQETKHELVLESGEQVEESDCLACDALDYFCETIDDEDAKAKCAVSVKAVQEGLLDAGEARIDIMGIIGEEAYESSVEKTNEWITDKFEKTRHLLKEAAKGAEAVEGSKIEYSDKMLPDEDIVSDAPLDKSDKFLPEE